MGDHPSDVGGPRPSDATLYFRKLKGNV
eukprot:COSAG02_NODE_17641_length_989_cov_2.215730_2_plen_27_part_01